MTTSDLPVLAFTDRDALRDWLESNHSRSTGIYVRLFEVAAGVPSVSFLDVLDEGLCFGWSESTRLPGYQVSYLQRFTPRRGRGTTSTRNRTRARALIEQGRMTSAGLAVLGDLG